MQQIGANFQTNGFQVGGYPINREGVNPELIRRMADSAGNIKVEGNMSSDEWSALADRVELTGQVSKDDYKAIQTLGRACFKHHRQLHADLRASRYQDQNIKAELQDVHVFRAGSDKIKESLALSQSQVAVDALAGASFGPTGLVTAFCAYSDMQKKNLGPLMEQIQGLRDGSSPALYQGNQTEGFHGDQIWKKMNNMLDDAAAQARAGNPQEVDAQYYELTSPEFVEKIADCAEAGCKVRVNVDPGRLVAFSSSHVVIDEVPDKLRAMLQLSQVDGNVGVSMYPIEKELGNPSDLMHRKGLRVGETFLLSGMNANAGSGENVDAGYAIEGPAAKRLAQNFARDVGTSAGSSMEQIFGEKPLADFMEADINMGSRGLVSLIDSIDGPSDVHTAMPKPTSYAEMKEFAAAHGQNIDDLVDATPEQIDKALGSKGELPLSKYGKEQFLSLAQRTVDTINSKENMSKVNDIDLPEGKAVGTTAVALADLPTEREAVMLQAIQEAEEFIYIPAFVMTKSIASMIVAKRDEMAAQGKDIDIRVVADPGMYPDGGTPNEGGVSFLEDHGIDVRWAMLPRSGSHDRKIHAKEVLTDKGEFFGSTNFSKKGLRDNWEHSGYVRFNEDNPSDVANRESAKAYFENLWENESVAVDTKAASIAKKRGYGSADKDYDVQIEEGRSTVVREILRNVQSFEKASAVFVNGQVEKDPSLRGKIDELVAQGYDEGSAKLEAVRSKMGHEAFYAALHSLPECQTLQGMSHGDAAFEKK
ncbi:hypothetical protein IJT17_10835 [bacterium]|nr:hypothetical protein [bacterium]